MANRLEKEAELGRIAAEIELCNICKANKTGKAVPGEGNPDAGIVFMGEAPGKGEAATGRPFVGRSGKFLREQIRNLGLAEEDVFITSPVKYLPSSGTPSISDVRHGRIHTLKQLAVIRPKIIVLLGAVAAFGILGEKISVVKDHGKTINTGGVTYFITIHPAAAVRFKTMKAMFIGDFETLKKLI